MNNENIKNILTQCFGERNVEDTNSEFDFRIKLSNNKVAVCEVKSDEPSTDTLRSLCQEYEKLDSQQYAPLLVLWQHKQELMYGIVAYWEYERMFINHNIKYRELSKENFILLRSQLHVSNNNIRLLPNDYIRVVKNINLNDDRISNGEIIYTRKFKSDYKMQQVGPLTESERFNRLVHGTPEEEYPHDNMDEILLQTIKSKYPQATCASELLLFDVDMLKYWRKKEKRQSIILLKYYDDSYNSADIQLECLYHKDIFGRNTSIARIVEKEVNSAALGFIKNNLKDIQPMSELNI